MLRLNKKGYFFITIIFVLIGIFFRFYQLNFENYWLDEMIAFWISDPSISLDDTFSRRQHIDQSPPLFHLLLNSQNFSIQLTNQ